MTPRAADLGEHARAAATGDKHALTLVIEGIRDNIYHLALRMLGHPADAEDATQEIVIVVLTHLGSFRGESRFQTWVWQIATRHLMKVRRGRRETLSLEVLDERLRTGLGEPRAEDPQADALSRELRARCTQAMLLSLDREHRVAYVLGDILDLSGEESAEILELEPAAYRKRLSRARVRLYTFVRGWCGVYDEANACRCAGQVACALERGILERDHLDLTAHTISPVARRAAKEIDDLIRVAEVIRGGAAYLAPATLVDNLRELVASERLELFRGQPEEHP
jgi:RNA polymerase sigma factor (sigma-70 family)